MSIHYTDTGGALLAPADALGALKVARLALRSAVFRLDERGLDCWRLGDVLGEVDDLVADWTGRPPPMAKARDPAEGLPECFSEISREYRRQRDRRDPVWRWGSVPQWPNGTK